MLLGRITIIGHRHHHHKGAARPGRLPTTTPDNNEPGSPPTSTNVVGDYAKRGSCTRLLVGCCMRPNEGHAQVHHHFHSARGKANANRGQTSPPWPGKAPARVRARPAQKTARPMVVGARRSGHQGASGAVLRGRLVNWRQGPWQGRDDLAGPLPNAPGRRRPPTTNAALV